MRNNWTFVGLTLLMLSCRDRYEVQTQCYVTNARRLEILATEHYQKVMRECVKHHPPGRTADCLRHTLNSYCEYIVGVYDSSNRVFTPCDEVITKNEIEICEGVTQ